MCGVWRTKGAEQRVQSPQSHQDWGQIVCHSTLQSVVAALMMCLFTAASVWVDYQAGMDGQLSGIGQRLNRALPLPNYALASCIVCRRRPPRL